MLAQGQAHYSCGFWDLDATETLYMLSKASSLKAPWGDLSPSLFWGEQTRFTAVPQCLLSSLEFVEIASTFGGLPAEMKLVRYFAENSVVLKKLSLRLKSSMDEQDPVALRDLLLALPTLSSACEIVVC
ncbi:hypothetical protein HID58_040536 [Brassica napus]|uniref:FBD domain-containing protein n=1 Tax=Brassica napus TaxID=3708 RepID=A0ABQ8B8J5_BRANA|nr:hypothetical protein HID58_040536 [Brassica napus]